MKMGCEGEGEVWYDQTFFLLMWDLLHGDKIQGWDTGIRMVGGGKWIQFETELLRAALSIIVATRRMSILSTRNVAGKQELIKIIFLDRIQD